MFKPHHSIILVLLVVAGLYTLYRYNKMYKVYDFINKYYNIDYLREEMRNRAEGKEGFVSNQCPTTMIKKGNQIMLYNPKLAKVPGVNPIVLSSLEDYEEYVRWQRASKVDCPILHLERMYDTQGSEMYEIKSSFSLDTESGPLNHQLPNIQKKHEVNEVLNAHRDNPPFNNNLYPAYDPYNQHVGVKTSIDFNY